MEDCLRKQDAPEKTSQKEMDGMEWVEGRGNEALQQFSFKAMNSRIELTLSGREQETTALVTFAKKWFHHVEERFSRFLPESELSHLNRMAGECCMVSETMLEVVHLAEMYRQMTHGIFDPLQLNALLQAGYTESFEQLHERNTEYVRDIPLSKHQQNSIKIDNLMKSIQLPEQISMDLGGIVKSWAVQRLVRHFQKKLKVDKGIINAGGDLMVWKESFTNESPWVIGIENPWYEKEEIGQLVLSNGSIATSSKLGRLWENERGKMHHIIDPRTMAPSNSDVVQCTVTGKSIMDCEIWAKVICIMGSIDGIQLLNETTDDCEALLFTSEQETHFYGREESLQLHWHGLKIDHYHFGGV
jgi:thiamine biosynthesis lipoprotein